MLKPYVAWLSRSVSLTVIIATLATVGIALAVFIVVGGVDVSADKPDGWLAEHLLHFVFNRSEASRAKSVIPPPDIAAPSRVRLAAQHFDMVCANCHGRPGFGQSVVALSMSPRPQYLPRVVGQFTDPELYMIVEHGVKFSGMPSWPTDVRGDEIWSMVAFLRRLPKMDANTYRDLTARPVNIATAPTGSDGGAPLRPANTRRDAPPVNEFLYAAPDWGFSDQTVHESPQQTCARCHGADGSGAVTGGEAPNLTLQDPAYLRAALEAYTRGSRKSGFMQNIAAQLSEARITDVARYYADLPVKAAAPSPADATLVRRGETIAMEGVPQLAIPACSTCHESAGAAVIGAPRIAGQSETFLRRELGAMRHGGRGATVWWNPMPAVAHDLGDKDIEALAAYYSGLKPTRASGGVQTQPGSPAMPAGQDRGDDAAVARPIFETRCVKCHLDGGRGDPQGNYPDLTLQSTPFVAQSLYAFHVGSRPSNNMRQATKDLSFHQLTSLAYYVNSLPPRRALAKPDLIAAQRGAAIAMRGDPARGVPACLSCHDAKDIAALPLIPRLQGQNVAYLRNRLNAFARPYAADTGALNPMPSIARPLTDGERADLAAYFAAAAPLEKPAPRP
jgi:cytochrome c553